MFGLGPIEMMILLPALIVAIVLIAVGQSNANRQKQQSQQPSNIISPPTPDSLSSRFPTPDSVNSAGFDVAANSCPSCGGALQDPKNFCPNCGTKL